MELLWKDILKAYGIFSQYILSGLCIILHGSLWVQLHGRVLGTEPSKMRVIMAGLSGCVGARTKRKTGTITFSSQYCLSLLHTAERTGMCLYHYFINKKNPVCSNTVDLIARRLLPEHPLLAPQKPNAKGWHPPGLSGLVQVAVKVIISSFLLYL